MRTRKRSKIIAIELKKTQKWTEIAKVLFVNIIQYSERERATAQSNTKSKTKQKREIILDESKVSFIRSIHHDVIIYSCAYVMAL